MKLGKERRRGLFHFEVTERGAGRYDFDFASETAKYATMKLYRVTQKNGKEVLIALNAAPGDVFDLSAGDYALKIASADNGKGKKNTAYNISVGLPDAGHWQSRNNVGTLG